MCRSRLSYSVSCHLSDSQCVHHHNQPSLPQYVCPRSKGDDGPWQWRQKTYFVQLGVTLRYHVLTVIPLGNAPAWITIDEVQDFSGHLIKVHRPEQSKSLLPSTMFLSLSPQVHKQARSASVVVRSRDVVYVSSSMSLNRFAILVD